MMRKGPLLAVAMLGIPAWGAVRNIEIRDRNEVAGGRSFGSSGAYERISGIAHFAIDPRHARNRTIPDIPFAPVNANGLVEFSADLYILRPVDLRKGNGTILFEVVNRGRKGMLAALNRAQAVTDSAAPESLGDGLLLESGYTLAWLGWQHDVPAGDGLMRLRAPVAAGVTGLVRSEYTPAKATSIIPLGDSGHIPYPIVPDGKVSVCVRDEIYGNRVALPRTEWTVDPAGYVRLASPTRPGRLYEVVYESTDPPIAALGLAGIRDLISYLKHDHKYAIGFGVSQSAMVLRGLVYEGFNQDESGKIVLDGILAHVAGARRSTFHRFIQASRTAGPLRNASLSTTEQFPFSDNVQSDPVSGIRDGLLLRSRAARQVPKILYTNSAYEYWGSAASLLHTTPDGKHDLPLPESTRLYMFSGGQHGPAAFPPRAGNGQNLPNFNDYRWCLRALLKSLQNWIVLGEPPAASVYPMLAHRNLTTVEQYRFPHVPKVEVPRIIHVPHALNFGPDYRSHGVIANEPPPVIGAYVALVPQADRDGNDAGGIRMPEIACPLGSFTGWNLRDASIGGTQYLLGQTGSYLPFDWTVDDRRADGDPRLAVAERFASAGEYLSCVEKSAARLVKQRLLLPGDVGTITRAAASHWQWRSQQGNAVSSSATSR